MMAPQIIQVPGDKSIAHRACLLAALGEGASFVRGLSGGGDNTSTIRCLRWLGVPIEPAGRGAVRIEGVGLRGLHGLNARLDCGNSGTTLRLLMGVLAGQRGNFTLSGDASLNARPMNRAAEPLRALGALIDLPEGDHPPVHVRGARLHGARHESRVASAQVKSAFLLAALLAEGESAYVENTPTRDHTERMFRRLGLALDTGPDGALHLAPPRALPAADWHVPGDPSSAAFWCAAALLLPGREVVLPGLCLNPHRTGFLRVLERMGAQVTVEAHHERDGEPVGRLQVRHGPLRGVVIGPDEVPSCVDELPLLALLAATAEGETVVTGAAELRVKECDRLAATAELLQADGAEIELLPDGWRIAGGHRLRGGFTARTHHDHRIALCAAVLGAAAEAPVALDHPEAAAVSYPGFLEELAALTGGHPAPGGAAT